MTNLNPSPINPGGNRFGDVDDVSKLLARMAALEAQVNEQRQMLGKLRGHRDQRVFLARVTDQAGARTWQEVAPKGSGTNAQMIDWVGARVGTLNDDDVRALQTVNPQSGNADPIWGMIEYREGNQLRYARIPQGIQVVALNKTGGSAGVAGSSAPSWTYTVSSFTPNDVGSSAAGAQLLTNASPLCRIHTFGPVTQASFGLAVPTKFAAGHTDGWLLLFAFEKA